MKANPAHIGSASKATRPAGGVTRAVPTSRSQDSRDERRKGGDRRVNEGAVKFPLIDCNDIYVVEDRRRIPDRRINDIEVEWVTDISRVL